jgi:hypothetical protein
MPTRVRASASAASAFLIRSERVDGAHPISAAAARSDDVPAAIFPRAAATCSSLNCFSNKPTMQVYSVEQHSVEQHPRSTHRTRYSMVNDAAFDK